MKNSLSIFPVVLAGGSGTRLWPVSRESYPKQFVKLFDDKSLFQMTINRLKSSDLVKFEQLTTITNSDFRFIAHQQLECEGHYDSEIFLEPAAKSTAPAILLASLSALAKNPDAIIFATPSDHVISSNRKFHNTIKLALRYATQGKIVTFGVVPSHAETGYGYLKLDENRIDADPVFKVENFIEKPSREVAETYLQRDNYLWNSGNFLFQASKLIEEFEKFEPETLRLTKLSLARASKDLHFTRLDEKSWSKLASDSIDYAIMEKTRNLVATPLQCDWSDLGSWEAVWQSKEKTESGLVQHGSVDAIDCRNSLLQSLTTNQHLVGLGLNNLIVVAMHDAVLVADKDRSQEVKAVVSHLKNSGYSQATQFPKDYRPWGWFESLARGDRFQVKRIFVKPGEALSLQSHHHRSEHWVVVEGTAEITINGEVKLLTEGQSIYVPLGAVHRLANTGKLPMVLIEVQIGAYLEEDDIIRYADEYNR